MGKQLKWRHLVGIVIPLCLCFVLLAIGPVSARESADDLSLIQVFDKY